MREFKDTVVHFLGTKCGYSHKAGKLFAKNPQFTLGSIQAYRHNGNSFAILHLKAPLKFQKFQHPILPMFHCKPFFFNFAHMDYLFASHTWVVFGNYFFCKRSGCSHKKGQTGCSQKRVFFAVLPSKQKKMRSQSFERKIDFILKHQSGQFWKFFI